MVIYGASARVPVPGVGARSRCTAGLLDSSAAAAEMRYVAADNSRASCNGTTEQA